MIICSSNQSDRIIHLILDECRYRMLLHVLIHHKCGHCSNFQESMVVLAFMMTLVSLMLFFAISLGFGDAPRHLNVIEPEEVYKTAFIHSNRLKDELCVLHEEVPISFILAS